MPQRRSAAKLPDLPDNLDQKNPQSFWREYFARRKPPLAAVRRFVHQLHTRKQHEHVIALIQSALVHGQSQPWMYEVLGLSMKIAGRPEAEVERVLLSRVDFTATNVPSMLYSAAYLTRLEAYQAALRLYRQASRLHPSRPEPYILGLKLAKRLEDFAAIEWAATGILQHGWTEDHQRLHQKAENAALDAKQALLRAGRRREAQQLADALKRAKRRDLILRLRWSGPGDLDLYVEEPAGSVCSVETPQSPGGGVLVHDGYGPKQENCHEDYVCAAGMSGVYRVRVRHVWGDIVGKRARLTITRYKGTSFEVQQSRTVSIGKKDATVYVALDGRRQQPRAIPEESQPQREKPEELGGSLLQKFGPMDGEAKRAGREFVRSRQIGPLRQLGLGAGGVNPGVARGAVGFQPNISIVREGVTLAAQAVVSADRRYVRLSVSPVFSALSDVFTFSFVSGGANAGGGTAGTGQ